MHLGETSAGPETGIPVLASTDRRRHRSSGQSLPEFALVLVPMLLLLLGAIQLGVIWSTQVGVANAVRDAARAASVVQPKGDSAGTVDSGTAGSYAGSIRTNKLLPSLLAQVPFYSYSNVQLASVCYATVTDVSGALALQTTVTVRYGHQIFIPLMAGILGNNLAATSTVALPVGLTQPYVLTAGMSGCSS